MRKSLFAAAALALCTVSVPAQAGVLGALVGTSFSDAKVKGKRKKDGRIEVETSMPAKAGQVEQVVLLGLVRMAEMTEAQGRDRFAVVKFGKCGTLMINYSPVRHQCKLTGRPVADGETAEPLGDDEVKYYNTATILALKDVDPADLMLALVLARFGVTLPNAELDAKEAAAAPVLEVEPAVDAAATANAVETPKIQPVAVLETDK